MSVTTDQGLLNATNMLDDALAAMRVKVDPADWRSAGSLFDALRAEIYGFNERAGATKGVIFGMDTCYFADIGTAWNLFGPPPAEDPLLGGPDGNSLVITRGSVYDGTEIVNVEPIEGKAYAYLVTLPDLGGSNCLASGGLFWDISNSTFKIVVRGSETAGHPPILLEKSYCTLERFLEAAFGDNPLDSALWPLESATLVRLARIVIDVSETGEQTGYFKVDKELYPMQPGQPSPYLMEFGNRVSDGINSSMKSYYDTTIVSSLMESFSSAAIWSGFQSYWSSGGRTCPSNVKYYWNRLYDPDIP
jgi:hypothetical protein